MRAPTACIAGVIPGLDAVSCVSSSRIARVQAEPSTAARLCRAREPLYFQPDLFLDLGLHLRDAGEEIHAPSRPVAYSNNADLLEQFISSEDEEERTSLRNELLQNNQGLVHEIAFRYANPRNGSPAELAAEGQMGLLNAINKCALEKIGTFAAYARFQIDRAIISYLRQKDEQILPEHAVRRLKQVRSAISDLAAEDQAKNRRGGAQEIYSDQAIAERAKLFPGTVKMLRPFLGGSISLDQPCDHADDNSVREVGEWLRDLVHSDTPADEVSDADDRVNAQADLTLALGRLTPLRANVVRMRFGLGCEEMSPAEIADHMDVSRQRVNHIIAESLISLRDHVARARSLRRLRNMGLRS